MNDGGTQPDRMEGQRRRRSVRAGALALLLFAAEALVPVVAAVPVATAWTAAAEARGFRSGGYHLPHSFGSTGSFFHGRTPSFSGGYHLPTFSTPHAPSFGGAGAGDRAFSRGRSAEGLHAFQTPRQTPRTPSTSGGTSRWSSGRTWSGWGGTRSVRLRPIGAVAGHLVRAPRLVGARLRLSGTAPFRHLGRTVPLVPVRSSVAAGLRDLLP